MKANDPILNEFDYFDRLPTNIAVLVREAPIPLSSYQIFQDYTFDVRVGGMKEVNFERMLKARIELARRANLKKYWPGKHPETNINLVPRPNA